ncbi:DUF3068 domain-containing protein [Actinocorallia lasiicapitis]
MRRGGFLLVMLGAFFVTLAPLMRFYVADGVVRAPLDFYEQITLRDEHASYLNRINGRIEDDTPLDASLTIRGDVKSGGKETAVWQAFLRVSAGSDDLAFYDYQMAFDRKSALLINGHKNTWIEGDTKVPQSGYGLMWPVGNVQKRSYELYDVFTRRTWPARYNGTETINGVQTYRFVQIVEDTKVGRVTTPQWPAAVGLPKTHPNVKVDRWHQATNTFWVDPRTGMPVKERFSVNETMQTRDRKNTGTFLTTALEFSEDDVKTLAERSDHYAQRIELVRTVLPGVFLVVGLLMLAAGGVISLYGGGAGPARARHAGPVKPPNGVEQVPPSVNDLLADGRK